MKNRILIALVSSLLTLLLVMVVLNLSPGEKRLDQQLQHSYNTADPQFRRSLGVLLGPPLLEGNQVHVLLNGEQIFPAMLSAIAGAKETINFESYIYWSESIGHRFSDALIERAKAGVTVHVLLDYVGSLKMDSSNLQAMRAAGIAVERYHKPVSWKLARLNNRDHRKLLIVDGRTGFTGGVGIADQWRGHAQDKEHWRDTQFQVSGPVVGQMQAVFVDNWSKVTGKVLDGDTYFPALPARGTQLAQMFSSSPTGGSESMHLMYLLAITAAKSSIALSNSYFVPDDLTVAALVAAAKRGVRIAIITPGADIDTELVRAASHAGWGPLLAAGITMAEYQPTMFHVKTLVVDGLLVSVGSTNFDNRSFSINDEANLNVLDRDFAAQQMAIFDEDMRHSKVITLRDWQQRSLKSKVAEHAAALVGAQL